MSQLSQVPSVKLTAIHGAELSNHERTKVRTLCMILCECDNKFTYDILGSTEEGF